MRLIDINEALQAVDNRIKELNTHEVFRKKADSIDVLGVKKWINNITPIEAIPKDEYEARLKADLKAILVELQLEIEELDPMGNEWSDSLDACNDVIQQKINALKENTDGKNV